MKKISKQQAVFDYMPVYPLLDAVLFPSVVLPLQVYHEADCEMMLDVLNTRKYLVVAKIKHHHVSTKAALHHMGCLVKIIYANKIRDGGYSVLLQGIQRVRLLEEAPSSRSYRCFHVQFLSRPSEKMLLHAKQEFEHFKSLLMHLMHVAQQTDQQLVDILHSTNDPISLLDIVSAVLIKDPSVQQHLLTLRHVKKRINMLRLLLKDVVASYSDPKASADFHG